MSANVQRVGQWLWFEPIYRFNVALLCCPATDAKKRIRRVVPEDVASEIDSILADMGYCCGRFIHSQHETTGTIVTLWFAPHADSAVIGHEVFHAVHSVLKAKGLTLSAESEEAYAYLLEWLMREVLNRRVR